MNRIQKWLHDRDIANPHDIPDEFKEDFAIEFPDSDSLVFWPQPGGQEEFQNCKADICLYGGEAGAGKSWSLLFDHLKWIHIPTYNGSVVRKTYALIFDAGGLWDEAVKLYNHFGGRHVVGTKPKFVFPSGAKIYFKHSQHAKKIDQYWMGLQSPVISIDEITQFGKPEFLYIVSRNRSNTGIDSYIRATCNPDPRSWVREFIDWWIDDDGYIIPGRSGVVRWFRHINDEFIWADTRDELIEKYGDEIKPKSATFIRGHLDDNKKLLEQDPGYKDSLGILTAEQQLALRKGNWNLMEHPDALFSNKNISAHRVKASDADIETMDRFVVGVDPAGSTNANSDLTGIVGVGRRGRELYVFRDETGKFSPHDWAKASTDLYDLYKGDKIVAEKNFGGDMVASTITTLRPDIFPKLVTASRGKAVRAEPVATLYEQGLVHHVGHGLADLEAEMTNWVPGESPSPNRLDALVWAIHELALSKGAQPRVW